MNQGHVFKGKIISGTGKAAFFTQLDWVVKQCSEKLGFIPFPGTLNIEMTTENVVKAEIFKAGKIVDLIPPDSANCAAQVVPVELEGVAAAIIVPEKRVKVHGYNIIEVIAPVNLRKALQKNDGDIVSGTTEIKSAYKRSGFYGIFKKIEVEAIMLDLDGTIIDSVEIYYSIVWAVLEKLDLPKVSTKQIKKANENGKFLWEKLFPKEMFKNQSHLKDEAWSIARKIAPEMFNDRVKLLPGAADILKRIAAQDLKLAVVTSTPLKNMKAKLKPLEEAEILHLLQEIITADDTIRNKPAADPLLECTRRLAIDVKKCVYVGDTLIDIQAGKAAGTRTIGVLTGFDNHKMLRKERPDAIIESLANLPEVVLI